MNMIDTIIDFNLKTIEAGHHKMLYRGVKSLKCPFDYVTYQMIINEVKPDLIIEIGTNHGASALYMADMLDLLGKGMIHTMDIMEYPMDPLIVNNPRIKRFLGGFESYDLKNAEGFKVKLNEKQIKELKTNGERFSVDLLYTNMILFNSKDIKETIISSTIKRYYNCFVMW